MVLRVDRVTQPARDDAGPQQQHGAHDRPSHDFRHLGARQAGEYDGTSPSTFSGAFIGALDSGASLVPGTNTKLTFNGGTSLTLAPGAGAWSDAVRFNVVAFQRLAVSLDVASASDISTHTLGLATNYYAPGGRAAESSGSGFTPVPAKATGTTVDAFPFYWLAAVDVASPSATGTIVAFGDSITDGRCSTTENGVVVPDKYQRWTDVLAARLASRPANETKAIANEAIAGNRIVSGGNGPPLWNGSTATCSSAPVSRT